MVLAVPRDQAAVTFRYILALIDGTPDAVSHGLWPDDRGSDVRRNRLLPQSEESRNPNKEILDALRPAMGHNPDCDAAVPVQPLRPGGRAVRGA